MIKESHKIIGINPGTRYLGIAVLYGQELMDWRIKVLAGKWKEEKIRRAIGIVSDLIERYEPDILAIKELHPARRTARILRLANEIRDFARRKRLKVYQYSIKDIEKRFVKGERLNKWNFVEGMVKTYPAIRHEVDRERSRRNPYYIRVFEAIGLAYTVRS